MLVDTNIDRGQIERETEKAYLVRVSNGVTSFHDRFVWVPKSQVTWQASGGFHESMWMPPWLARKIFH